MCVTTGPASMGRTSAYTLASFTPHGDSLHYSGYQNTAQNHGVGPNCMLLHFPGSDLQMVDGPQHAKSFLPDITSKLPSLQPAMRGGSFGYETRGSVSVQEYGAYHVVIAEYACDIADALSEVPVSRRPIMTPHLRAMLDWYEQYYQDYGFVLACFDSAVQGHGIVVQYVPHNDDVLFVPGLDAHSGFLPNMSQPVRRDIRVAFGSVLCQELPYEVKYSDDQVAGNDWAPKTVTGFFDDRLTARNGDYVVALESLQNGLYGHELAGALIM